MNNTPAGKAVVCPKCEGENMAIVPNGSDLVESEEDADGKVWVNCNNCGNRFLAYYQIG